MPRSKSVRLEKRRENAVRSAAWGWEALEPRTLLNATVISQIPTVTLLPNTSATPIVLSSYFDDPLVTGTAVEMDTTQGTIFLALDDAQTPKTVANFMYYVNNGEYNGTVIQRAVPGFILQGGGFLPDQSHIDTQAPVQSEAGIPNTLGTIAMALSGGDPNSATSDWFINDADNSSTLDSSAGGGPFTVFGTAVYGSMDVVNQIEALPKGAVAPNFEPDVAAGDPPGGVLPLQNYNQDSPILDDNYVTINSIEEVPALGLALSNDNTSLVTANISNGDLTLTAGSGTGVANITITAEDLGGNEVTSTFAVEVGQTVATVGKGAAKEIHFTDPSGTAGQLTLSGPGTASLAFGGNVTVSTAKNGIATVNGTPLNITLTTSGTTAASKLTLTGKGGSGSISLSGITITGSLHTLSGTHTTLTGNLSATGSIGSLSLASATSGTLSIGSGAAVTLSIPTVTGEGITSAAPIQAITGTAWTGGQITAPSIGTVKVKQGFTLSISAASLKSFQAASIGGGDWTITGATGTVKANSATNWQAALGTLKTLSIVGALDSSLVRASGSISSVTAKSLSGTGLFAGITAGSLPSVPSDVASSQTIGSLKISGAFVNGNVAAANLAKASVGSVQTSNGGTPFGFAAEQIGSLTTVAGGKHLRLSKITSAGQVEAALTAQGIIPQDLVIRIV